MKKRFTIPLIIIALSAVLTVTGRLSKGFADFYADNIFPLISTPYAFISGLLPISLGEIMIITAIIAVALGIPATIVCIIIKKTRKKAVEISLTTALWMLTFVVATESLNCFTLYGCTRFSERFFTPQEHDNDELKQVYSLLIDECNELALQVQRDEHNRFVLTIDAVDECRESMKKASEQYPQLKGYYPKPKPVMFSFFMSQTGTAGMYMPFSMEATIIMIWSLKICLKSFVTSTHISRALCRKMRRISFRS